MGKYFFVVTLLLFLIVDIKMWCRFVQSNLRRWHGPILFMDDDTQPHTHTTCARSKIWPPYTYYRQNDYCCCITDWWFMIRRCIFLLNYCGESRCYGNRTKISILVFCIALAIEKVWSINVYYKRKWTLEVGPNNIFYALLSTLIFVKI